MASTTASEDEFPGLSSMGLYARDIRGDGNCLFNALSDQLYGHQDEHASMRARTIEYMRTHVDEFKPFIDVNAGGGTRRNPKRKNAGAFSAPAAMHTPTAAEVDRVWQDHLTRMAKGGTWGDNMEISAFSKEYQVDVRIYQRDFAYNVPAGPEDEVRPVLHIAYHTWEHYSSIRNLNGPHEGLPNVSVRALSPDTEAKQKEKLARAPYAQPWQIDVVSKSLPYLTDKSTIKKALEDAKGNIDNAVSKLLEQEDSSSGRSSATQGSSSIERDHDSDDKEYNEYWGSNKKRDRRASRPIKTMKSRNKSATSEQATDEGSSTGLEISNSQSSSAPASSQPDADADSENEWHSDSEFDSKKLEPKPEPEPAPQKKGPLRIRLTLPKAPAETADDSSSKSSKAYASHASPPQHRKVHARDKKHMMKKAQKAARKERAQATAKSSANKALPIITKGGDKEAEKQPPSSPHIKMLSI